MPPHARPERIGRYELLARLATGGMAEVFLTRLRGPSGFERPVVVKRILPHLANEGDFRRMFVDEARIVSQIRHPNVVHVHELGDDGDDLFLAMEYLEGESLAAVVHKLAKSKERLSPALAAHIVAEACAGLHAAHEIKDAQGSSMGVVHRDVSPHNVFVLYTGQIKVIDFGIAKATNQSDQTTTGQLKGKSSYMAPEQILAEPLDRRTDVFALGIILHELVTAGRLFDRANDLLVFKAVCEQPIPSPMEVATDVPRELADICMRALARDRAARYPTAAAMRRDLVAAARDLASDELPEEVLAALMRKLFAARLKKKQDALRRHDDGEMIMSFPGQSTDSEVHRLAPKPEAGPLSPLSSESPPSRRDATAAAVQTETADAPPARAGRSRAVMIGIAAVVVASVLGITIFRPSTERPAPTPGAAADAPEAKPGDPAGATLGSGPPSGVPLQTTGTGSNASASAPSSPSALTQASGSAQAGERPRSKATASAKSAPRSAAPPSSSAKSTGFHRFD